jgi:acetylornithine deacetylase
MRTVEDTALDVTELLSALVRFESLSHHEGPIADFVADTLDVPAVVVSRFENNVVARLGEGSSALLLNSHLDVVPASSNHPYEPFVPTIVGGRLFGRGSVDAKSSVAAMIAAFRSLADEGWTAPDGYCLVAAFTACEEVGGTNNGLEAVRAHLPELVSALIGEPTSLTPCTAQKGLLIVDATAEGRTAHAARPHLGVNAIEIMARDIARLSQIDFDRKHPLLGRTIATATVVRGGSSHNVIPDRCDFTIDARITPSYTTDEVLDLIAGALDSRISVRSRRYVPVETEAEAAVARAAVAVTGKPTVGSATASDWVYVRDVPTVKIGPGDTELSHTPDESIDIEELRRAPSVYRSIIESFFESVGS